MDPFAFLEHIVSTYQVPRQFFHIEVTESALTRDTGVLKNELFRFKKAGYQNITPFVTNKFTGDRKFELDYCFIPNAEAVTTFNLINEL